MVRCPRCGQTVSRRSPRAALWERAASLVYLYPFRCQLCACRFHAFHVHRYTRHATDRREYERLMVRVPVVVTGAEGTAEGVTGDLSLDGCSIRTDTPLEMGSHVQVRLRIGPGTHVDVESAVVRSQHEGMLGLHFDRLAPGDRDRLSHYIARFLRPAGTRPRRRGIPRPELLLVALVGLGVIVLVFMIMSKAAPPPPSR